MADLGVTADWLGQLLVYLLPKMEATNRKGRIQALWLIIQELYDEVGAPARLDEFTENMLSLSSRSPKLRCHGAEARAFVPVAGRLAERFLQVEDEHEAMVRQATLQLVACYNCLSATAERPRALADHCRRFCTLWVGCEAINPTIFLIKPKMHLFQELCEMQDTRPAMHWTYRDEDFGGSLVSLGKRRGGKRTAKATGRQILTKFFARHPLPNFARRPHLAHRRR